MTAEPELSDADYRRALGLLCHVGSLDAKGAVQALADAGLTGPGARMALALALLCFDITPGLRSPEGLAMLREMLREHAAAEAEADAAEADAENPEADSTDPEPEQ